MENSLKEALELVKAQARVRVMSDDAIISMLKKLVECISSLTCMDHTFSSTEKSMTPQESIKEKSITCLICGKPFKLLTRKHMASHNLTVEEYRERYGYKKGTPLVCKHLQRQRRKRMQTIRIWERRQK